MSLNSSNLNTTSNTSNLKFQTFLSFFDSVVYDKHSKYFVLDYDYLVLIDQPSKRLVCKISLKARPILFGGILIFKLKKFFQMSFQKIFSATKDCFAANNAQLEFL